MKPSAFLVLLTLGACHPLPDLGPTTAPAGPPPTLLPLDELLSSPLPTATADSAAALAARGAAIKADALAQP